VHGCKWVGRPFCELLYHLTNRPIGLRDLKCIAVFLGAKIEVAQSVANNSTMLGLFETTLERFWLTVPACSGVGSYKCMPHVSFSLTRLAQGMME
jgi:hypothetical protein